MMDFTSDWLFSNGPARRFYNREVLGPLRRSGGTKVVEEDSDDCHSDDPSDAQASKKSKLTTIENSSNTANANNEAPTIAAPNTTNGNIDTTNSSKETTIVAVPPTNLGTTDTGVEAMDDN